MNRHVSTFHFFTQMSFRSTFAIHLNCHLQVNINFAIPFDGFKRPCTKRLPVLKSRHFVQQLLLCTVDSNFSSAESSFREHFSLAELKIFFSGEIVYSFVFGLLWKDAVHASPSGVHSGQVLCLFSHCRLDFCALQFLKVVLSVRK